MIVETVRSLFHRINLRNNLKAYTYWLCPSRDLSHFWDRHFLPCKIALAVLKFEMSVKFESIQKNRRFDPKEYPHYLVYI